MQGRHKEKLSNGCCISFESALYCAISVMRLQVLWKIASLAEHNQSALRATIARYAERSF
jgi:hypothetical protein